jgi:transcriptional regulator with XRE-family HTH domain
MARGGLGLSVRELARLSGVNKATVVRTEAGLAVRADTLVAIRKALEEAGAEFLVCSETGKIAVALDA